MTATTPGERNKDGCDDEEIEATRSPVRPYIWLRSYNTESVPGSTLDRYASGERLFLGRRKAEAPMKPGNAGIAFA